MMCVYPKRDGFSETCVKWARRLLFVTVALWVLFGTWFFGTAAHAATLYQCNIDGDTSDADAKTWRGIDYAISSGTAKGVAMRVYCSTPTEWTGSGTVKLCYNSTSGSEGTCDTAHQFSLNEGQTIDGYDWLWFSNSTGVDTSVYNDGIGMTVSAAPSGCTYRYDMTGNPCVGGTYYNMALDFPIYYVDEETHSGPDYPLVSVSNSELILGLPATVSGSFSGATGTGLVHTMTISAHSDTWSQELNECTFSPSTAAGSCSGEFSPTEMVDYVVEATAYSDDSTVSWDSATVAASYDPRTAPWLEIDTPDGGDSLVSGQPVYFHVRTSVPWPMDDSAPVNYGLAIERWDGATWIPATHASGGVISTSDVLYTDTYGAQNYTGGPPFGCLLGSCPSWLVYPRYSYGETPYNAFLTGLADGTWRIKARVQFNGFGWSEYSPTVAFAIGGEYDFTSGGNLGAATLAGDISRASGGMNPTTAAPVWSGDWGDLPGWLIDYLLWLFIPDFGWIMNDLMLQANDVFANSTGLGQTVLGLVTFLSAVLDIQPDATCPFGVFDSTDGGGNPYGSVFDICDDGGLTDALGVMPQMQAVFAYLLSVGIDVGLFALFFL